MQEGREPGRGERIRTSGLYVPNVALYQAKLHPDLSLRWARARQALSRNPPGFQVDRCTECRANCSSESLYTDPDKPCNSACAASA
jgi:hypothetical protein